MGILNKQEVIYLVAHLIITLFVITAYFVIYLVTGESDQTLKLAVYVIMGYWFGAVGKAGLSELVKPSKNDQTKKGA
jgi:hypothetical protein